LNLSKKGVFKLFAPFKKYARFNSRSTRKEFNLFLLFHIAVFIVAVIITVAGGLITENNRAIGDVLFYIGGGLLVGYSLFSFLPFWALML
jgi:uncharacterized membrane protein YhaH (DUF805 family)